MSASATFWAWRQSTTSTQKLTLLALANCHNEGTGQCNPSVNHISSVTGLNRKTVIKSIAELEGLGLIESEKGNGKSTNYTIKSGSYNGTGTENNTGTEFGTCTSANIGSGTGTENGTRPVPKTVPKPKKKLKDESKIEPKPNITQAELKKLHPEINPGLIDQWFIVRKDKGAKSLTKHAWEKFKNESIKAGYSLDKAVETCVDRHWRGFNASWVGCQPQSQQPSGMRNIKPMPIPGRD